MISGKYELSVEMEYLKYSSKKTLYLYEEKFSNKYK